MSGVFVAGVASGRIPGAVDGNDTGRGKFPPRGLSARGRRLDTSPSLSIPYEGAIEAFNAGLFVLLIGAGNAMPVAIVTGLLSKRPFELRAPISLQNLDTPRKAPGHGRMEKGHAIITGEGESEHDGRFLRVNVDSSKGKQVVEPVFGQIKQARGFRQFLLRGQSQVAGEWSLVCSAHNLLKLAGARG